MTDNCLNKYSDLKSHTMYEYYDNNIIITNQPFKSFCYKPFDFRSCSVK